MLKFCSTACFWPSPKSLSYAFHFISLSFIPLKWTPPIFSCVFVPLREPDGQASGGNDFGSDDWIFTIREKDPKKLQNGASPTGEEVGDRTWLLCWVNGSLSHCVTERPMLSQEPNKRPLSQSLSTVITPVLTEVGSDINNCHSWTVNTKISHLCLKTQVNLYWSNPNRVWKQFINNNKTIFYFFYFIPYVGFHFPIYPRSIHFDIYGFATDI